MLYFRSMKSSDALERHRADIRRIVQANRARNPRVFGSVLHGDDTEDSDLDLLVDPTEQTSLFDIARLAIALEELLGVTVDIVTPDGLRPRIQETVLREAVPI